MTTNLHLNYRAYNIGERTVYVSPVEIEAIHLVQYELDKLILTNKHSPWYSHDELEDEVFEIFEDVTLIAWGDLSYLADPIIEQYRDEVG